MNFNKGNVRVDISGNGKISVKVNDQNIGGNNGKKQKKQNQDQNNKKENKKNKRKENKINWRFYRIAQPNNPKEKESSPVSELSAPDNFGSVLENGKIKPNPNSKMNRHKKDMATRGANAQATAEAHNMGSFIGSDGKLKFNSKGRKKFNG